MNDKKIYKEEVIAFLDSWKEGIIAIGKEYLDDFKDVYFIFCSFINFLLIG